MSQGNPEEIRHLVTALQSDSEVTWDEVEERLDGFPGWLQVVETLHNYTPDIGPMRPQIIPFEEYVIVVGSKRKHLLELFQPYALLLDLQLTPLERARLLKENGVNVKAFCEECLQHESEAVVQAAQAVLDADENERTLLRGGDAPAARMLPHPTEAPAAEAPPHKPGLLERLFGKHKSA